MAGTRITVLTCGHTTLDLDLVATGHPDPSVFRHLMPCYHHGGSGVEDGKIAHPVYAYIIHHDDGLVLVDTGMSDTFSADWGNSYYTNKMAYDPGEDGLFTQRLAQLDLKPGDFDDLIITHLHTDHAGNVPLFTKEKTRIIVHEDELRGVVNAKGGLLRDDTTTLWGVSSPQGFTRRNFRGLLPDRATTVYGDQEIHRRLWTVSLPGHTWGSMGVAVELAQSGWVLLASDHIYLAGSYGQPFIGNILNQNPAVWAQSAEKVRRLVEKYDMTIFPGHDSKIIVPDADGGHHLEDVAPAYD
jgi:glyoxylase-like metal-dependent hydrolase (beta-lactamase superfamily II)